MNLENNITFKEKNIFFYNRSDKLEILNELSPIRNFIQYSKMESYLHYIGLLANTLCILVLTRRKMIFRKSIFYLIFLAFSDLMYNFIAQLPLFLIDTKLINFNIFKTSNLSCFFYGYMTIIFHFNSVLITLFVTIDRFNHIHNPLKFNQNIISSKSKATIGLGLLAISFLIALPHGFLMVYNENENDCDARSFFRRKIGEFSYYMIYFMFFEPTIIWFIPGIAIVFMNS
jgi:hypothetical protein